MEISQRLLCFLFLSSFAFGILWGILYDLLYLVRFFIFNQTDENATLARSCIPRRKILFRIFLFFGDFLFVLLGGIGLLLLLYLINDGVFRMWGPCGMLAGFYVYRVTVSSLILRICQWLIRLLWRFLKLIWRVLCFPVRIMTRWIFRLIFAPILRYVARKHYEKSLRRAERRMIAFLEEADRIFPDQDEVLWNDEKAVCICQTKTANNHMKRPMH